MPTLCINKEILQQNIDITKHLAADAHVIGVIKGNGYGLGLIPYARFLVESGIEMLAVSEIKDAVTLRNAGITCDILMLSPLYQKKDIEQALNHYIILCITSFECGEIAEQTAKELNLYARAHICVDTGLGRYGFSCTHARDIIYTIDHMKHICITGIYSHFSSAACRKSYHNTMHQFARFTNLCDTLEQKNVFIGFRHIAASCALLRYPETKLDAVRIGSAFLGRLPMKDQWGYHPVGWLKAPISDIHTLPAGHNIGYGQTFITTRKTTVAIVPVGYSHGLGMERKNDSPKISCLPRKIYHLLKEIFFQKKLFAYYNEEAFPVLGKIEMNCVIIDITGHHIKIGDTVRFPVNPIYIDSNIPRCFS